MNKDFIDVKTDRGEMLIRKDKITCVYEVDDGRHKCVIIPSNGDFIKIGVFDSFESVVHQLMS